MTATIVLVHGLWMTPKSWDTWIGRFTRGRPHGASRRHGRGSATARRRQVRANPEALKGIGLKAIADHYERIIVALPERPIIMGHSFGGALTQMLADRGLGRAYVGVAPGQPAGITTLPPSTVRTGFPILRNPFNRNGASPISKPHFHFTFGNDLSREASDAIWEEYAINSYNRVFFEGVASAFNEKGGVTHVDYGRADRAPLLVIAGGHRPRRPARDLQGDRREVPGLRRAGPGGVSRVRRPDAPSGQPGRVGGDRRLRPRLGTRARHRARRLIPASSRPSGLGTVGSLA